MDPLLQAIALATANVRGGGEPFGAIVVTKNGTHYTGVNSVEANSDPTAHAEILALRAAAKVEGPVLSGAVLYASGEPCPMCLAAALWAGVDRLIYAASREDAGKYGLDSTPLYEQVGGGVATVVDFAVERRNLEQRLEPFEVWAGAASAASAEFTPSAEVAPPAASATGEPASKRAADPSTDPGTEPKTGPSTKPEGGCGI